MHNPDVERNMPKHLTYHLDDRYIDRTHCPIFGRNAIFTYNGYSGLLQCNSQPWMRHMHNDCICCGPEEYMDSAELIFNVIQARRKLVSG